jgi:phosphoglycolate phosphatase-like HAD superfamily hydrolase
MIDAPARRTALVIAFDGVLAATLRLRREALRDGGALHGVVGPGDDLLTAIPGRTLTEGVDWLRAYSPGVWAMDETTRDLVVLSAHQAYRRQLMHGVSCVPSVVERLHQAARAGERVVLRADSSRSDVAPLLSALGLEPFVTWVRASDDAGGPSVPAGTSSVERSWQAIGERLRRWQCEAAQVEVHESCAVAAAAATPFAHKVRTVDDAL